MQTDTTPRDVLGQPLQIGRWYWRRSQRVRELVACVQILYAMKTPGPMRRGMCSDRCDFIDFAGHDWLPADGPPAWPEASA